MARKSQRVSKRVIPFDERQTSPPPRPAKKAKKKQPEVPETKPANVDAAAEVADLSNKLNAPYIPPLVVPETRMTVLASERDSFGLFMRLLGWESLLAIVAATNARAAASMQIAKNRVRPWSTLTPGELLLWLGLLFYMTSHIEKRRHEYWKSSRNVFGQWMGRNRWHQIHRFLTFNIKYSNSANPLIDASTPWFDRLQPVLSIVRHNCQTAIIPSSWVAVDEIMVPFSGLSSHIVKAPNKPTDNGFKIWGLASSLGFLVDWAMHSPKEGAEGYSRQKKRWFLRPIPLLPIQLAETYQVPLILMERLKIRHNSLKWLVFLDNLFLTVNVAHVLMCWSIGVMGTTRKNSAGFPPELQRLKEINHAFEYGGVRWQQAQWALAFAWQDNNVVLALTTAFSVHRPIDFIVKPRRRPKDSSTNAAITRPVFQGQAKRDLPIPIAIDAYNNNMNYVDVANQLRGNFSCHLSQQQRNWRPLGFWLFDICITNAFVIWRELQDETVKRGRRCHEIFENDLINEMLRRGPCHQSERLDKRGYCAWGSRNPEQCLAAAPAWDRDKRRPLGEISGNETRGSRSSRRARCVITGCKTCNVHLCTTGPCYTNWHEDLLEKCI